MSLKRVMTPGCRVYFDVGMDFISFIKQVLSVSVHSNFSLLSIVVSMVLFRALKTPTFEL